MTALAEQTLAPSDVVTPLHTPEQALQIRQLLDHADILPKIRAQATTYKQNLCSQWILLCDVAALILAFMSGGVIAWTTDNFVRGTGLQAVWHRDTIHEFLLFVILGACALLWLDARGHYRHRLPFWESVGNILAVACIGFLLCGFVEFASQGTFSRLWMGLSWVLFAVFLFTGRNLVRRALMKSGRWQIPTLLVGTGASSAAAMHALIREPHMGLVIVEQIGADALPQLARPNAWSRLLHTSGARYILLALEGDEIETHRATLKTLVRERLPCSIVPPWLGLPTGTLSPHHFLMHDVLLMHDTNRLTLPLPRFLKRSFDIMISGFALLCLAPLFLVVALMVRRDNGPAFFRQQRIGRGGKSFTCYKFRSMRIGAEAYLDNYLKANPAAAEEWRLFQKLKTDVRITRFGNVIRRTSIDELPQLINVFKGDMSLVGPRPITPGQEQYYGDDFIYYESVRPGITGPWQVCGRNTLPFSERVLLESSYARNWSLWMDIVILLKTLPAVLKNGQAF